MKKAMSTCIRTLGLILFFGLCIAMRSKGVEAFAADGEPKLNLTNVSIIKDGTVNLRVYNLTDEQTVMYRSNDPDIASVTTGGAITGVSLGSTSVTATVLKEETPQTTLQCDVLIGPAAISIKFTKSEVVLQEGGSKLLNTIIAPLNTVEEPVFYSTDSEKVTVSSAGRVRAKEAGVVQVYAFLANQQAACCSVVVLNDEDYKSYTDGKDLDEIISAMTPVIEEVPCEEPEITTEEVEAPMVPAADTVAESEGQNLTEETSFEEIALEPEQNATEL